MADVFISYHEASAGELAQKIAEALDAAGISSWCARRDMPDGGDFAKEIPTQINACKVFLLILNDSAVYQSQFVENELGLAFGRLHDGENIVILPLEFGDFTRETWAKYYLVHTQSIKFPPQPDERRIQGLVKRIVKRLNSQTLPPIVPLQPSGAIIRRGECGKNVTYTLDENGILTISGSGAMDNLKASRPPWMFERDMIFHVEIQHGITAISTWAFSNCTRLTSVHISNSVTSIGRMAFQHCTYLKSVVIPDSVTSIGFSAFLGCAELTSVNIPDSVTSIQAYAFRDCIKLTNVSVPSETKIHPEAFSHSACVTRRKRAKNQ